MFAAQLQKVRNHFNHEVALAPLLKELNESRMPVFFNYVKLEPQEQILNAEKALEELRNSDIPAGELRNQCLRYLLPGFFERIVEVKEKGFFRNQECYFVHYLMFVLYFSGYNDWVDEEKQLCIDVFKEYIDQWPTRCHSFLTDWHNPTDALDCIDCMIFLGVPPNQLLTPLLHSNPPSEILIKYSVANGTPTFDPRYNPKNGRGYTYQEMQVRRQIRPWMKRYEKEILQVFYIATGHRSSLSRFYLGDD